MTTEERLAAIELQLANINYQFVPSLLACETLESVPWLIAEVRRLTDENKQLQENYEMAKRIIHSAGGLTRETLP